MSEIIKKLQGKQEQQREQQQECNYRDNYYGDQACRRGSGGDKEHRS